MDILSNYRISSHWANDESNLDLAAERVRLAEEREPHRPAKELPRRHGLLAGRVFNRTRNA